MMRLITLLELEDSVPTADLGMRFFSSCERDRGIRGGMFKNRVLVLIKAAESSPCKQPGTLQLRQKSSGCCDHLVSEPDERWRGSPAATHM